MTASTDGTARDANADGVELHPDPDFLENVRPPDWPVPDPPDCYAYIVIGGGPAGLLAAQLAAAMGARTALIERHWLGGESLNYGSVPTKVLHRAARLYADMQSAARYGVKPPADVDADADPLLVLARAKRVRTRLSRVRSAARLKQLGVDIWFGNARFSGSDTIDVDGRTLRFRKALIATGSTPNPVTIPGLAEAGYIQASTIFNVDKKAESLLVIGGGPDGCEAAQSIARTGVKTVIAMREPLFLPGEERDAAQMISDALANDGVEIHLNTEATRVWIEGGKKVVELVNDGEKRTVEVDRIFVGLGRMPATEGLELERAGIRHDEERGVHVDDFLRTSNRRVFAAGDVCLRPRFTSVAYASARIATANALTLPYRRFSRLTIPWCTYTDPEIAHVGSYVREARERGVPIKTLTVQMHDVDRAVVDGEETGFVKIHVREGSGRILGATIVARHAGEMINEISLAIVAKMKIDELSRVLRAYPTQAEAIRMAADSFLFSRVPWWLRWLTRAWVNR